MENNQYSDKVDMNATKIKKFNRLFLQRKAEILANVKKTSLQEDLDISGDEIDAAQGKAIFDMVDALTNRDKDSIRKIDNALRKIEKGTFGICEECEEPISEKRLLAIPDCASCISCAELAEATRRQFGR